MLLDTVRYLGPMPTSYRRIFDVWASIFGLDRSHKGQDVETNWTELVDSMLRKRVPRPQPPRGWMMCTESIPPRRSPEEDANDVRELFSLIRQMLRWDPDDRISAEAALNSDFFKDMQGNGTLVS